MDEKTFEIALKKFKAVDLKKGGMGKVYILKNLSGENSNSWSMDFVLARSPDLQDRYKYVDRPYLAAKTILSSDLWDMFLRELNIWLAFDHPGCVPLLQIIRNDGMLYAVMPYYEKNLSDMIFEKPVKPNSLLKSMIRCVEFLNEAKTKGVIHLDLKPENILIQQDGESYISRISDWGIANILQTHVSRSAMHRNEMFRTLIGYGTLPYMAPERILQAKPDYLSDIFSLGIIFYEILLGSFPYATDSDLGTSIISGSYYENAEKNLWSL